MRRASSGDIGRPVISSYTGGDEAASRDVIVSPFLLIMPDHTYEAVLRFFPTLGSRINLSLMARCS